MYNKIIDNEVKNIISRFKQSNNVNTSVKDLTHLKTYSIDDYETFEIDDAISLEKISYPSGLTKGSKAIILALLTAVVKSLCCLAVNPVSLLGKIFPLSVINFFNNSTSL